MKVLVTGASGFIGNHLCTFLVGKNITVYAQVRNKKVSLPRTVTTHFNLNNQNEVEKAIENISPDIIFHLAAQSLIMPSWEDPLGTFRTNIDPTIYILNAARKFASHCRVIIVGSSSEYAPSDQKLVETDNLQPGSPYALSKIVQDYVGSLYHQAYGIDIVRVRPFYIIGPGKKNDSVSEFCQGIISIEQEKQKDLHVGNLQIYRDYLDISDFINGLWIVAKRGKSGEVYNICSGEKQKVEDILNMLISFSTSAVKVSKCPEKIRPIDDVIKVGNNEKLKKLGWSKKVALHDSLKSIMTYWRTYKE